MFRIAPCIRGAAAQLLATCVGTLAQTHAGSGPPSQESGPYPLYNNGNQVNVFDSPSTSANLQGQLQDGTYVHLVCSSRGSPVLGPTDIYGTSVGTSTNWNRIDAPVIGWVSDAFVDSASATSVATDAGFTLRIPTVRPPLVRLRNIPAEAPDKNAGSCGGGLAGERFPRPRTTLSTGDAQTW